MARPATTAQKIQIRIPAEMAEWVAAQKETTGWPVASIVANLAISGWKANGTGAPVDEEAGRLPREQWPLETILADRAWLEKWYPQLRRILGRKRGEGIVTDSEGYTDWMGTAFPPIQSEKGSREWWSPDYGHWARLSGDRLTEQSPADHPPPRRRHLVWEPSVRHLVLGLSAVAAQAEPGRAALATLRMESEIRTTWAAVFKELISSSDGVAGPTRKIDDDPVPR